MVAAIKEQMNKGVSFYSNCGAASVGELAGKFSVNN